ncbi:unnamed protein product [Boreogadus saida]
MTHVHRHIGAACFAGEVKPPVSLDVLPELVQLPMDTPALLLLGRLPLQEPTHRGKVRPLKRVSAGCLVLSMAIFLPHLE